MELKLNVNKVLILDTEFNPDMLEGGNAVIGTLEGKSVLMVNVNLEDITKQAFKKTD